MFNGARARRHRCCCMHSIIICDVRARVVVRNFMAHTHIYVHPTPAPTPCRGAAPLSVCAKYKSACHDSWCDAAPTYSCAIAIVRNIYYAMYILHGRDGRRTCILSLAFSRSLFLTQVHWSTEVKWRTSNTKKQYVLQYLTHTHTKKHIHTISRPCVCYARVKLCVNCVHASRSENVFNMRRRNAGEPECYTRYYLHIYA